ncbi:MAG: D-alanyl-D-alanine carboxypeptidase, partial [Candidatus Eremiobacteraeota bacterium]|nr:D-alanyl-D-alanine carboxypeptidase [Candidatus Eremiobacteraeota bacterium]
MSAARLVRLFLGAAIAVASLGCAHPAPESVSAPALAPPKTAGALPVSHVAPWTPHARAAIAAELDGAFRDGIFAQSGAVAVVDEAGRPLYLRRARVPMTPASTLKLVVAAAALNTFGPNHRFETAFVALAPPDDSGLLGELWFVGGGDPLLTANDLRGGIGALRRLGVRRLMGPLAVDASEFR